MNAGVRLNRNDRLFFCYPDVVSPTVLRVRGFRFYFFSREETRAHVHVQHADGEAKFWIEPTVDLATNFSLSPKQVAEAHSVEGGRS